MNPFFKIGLFFLFILVGMYGRIGLATPTPEIAIPTPGHGTASQQAEGIAPPTMVVPSAEDNASDQVVPPHLFHGERLEYEVRYLGIVAGKALLMVSDPIPLNGRLVYPLLSTVQSSDFVSMIYPVNDRIESYFDVVGLYSHRIEVKQHEGKRKRERRIDFDYRQQKAIQTKDNSQGTLPSQSTVPERKVFDIPSRVNDFLSAIYYFRAQRSIEVGRSVFVDVHESGKNWKLEMRVLQKETVTTPLGRFNTIKTQAMASYEGIFLSKKALFIWMTDDDRRIPVKIASKIPVGTITLSLTSRRLGSSDHGERPANVRRGE